MALPHHAQVLGTPKIVSEEVQLQAAESSETSFICDHSRLFLLASLRFWELLHSTSVTAVPGSFKACQG